MILLTGASGFIGGHLLHRLLRDKQPVRALVRGGAATRFIRERDLEVAEGDVTRPAGLPAALRGVDCVVHLVGLIKEPPGVTFESVVAEGTCSLVNAAVEAGVRRFVYLSAVGTRAGAASRYHQTKWLAEEAVRAAPLEHVVVRPSVVYGRGDEFVNLFARAPIPLIGGGHNRLQPVFVGDLVELLAGAVLLPEVVGQTWEIGGPQPMTLREMVAAIERVTGRRRLHPNLPLAVAQLNAWLFDTFKSPLYRLGIVPPLTRDTLRMLETDNVCDPGPACAAFGLTLTDFETGLRTWL
ncbi:MAG: complex I NDUFA9 subunit family protein [Armatimonadetes bacterium]|nr:complex I NDUFA9 subunit family protein [Armatimonadota bacterium]